jgi:hypothetical protein
MAIFSGRWPDLDKVITTPAVNSFSFTGVPIPPSPGPILTPGSGGMSAGMAMTPAAPPTTVVPVTSHRAATFSGPVQWQQIPVPSLATRLGVPTIGVYLTGAYRSTRSDTVVTNENHGSVRALVNVFDGDVLEVALGEPARWANGAYGGPLGGRGGDGLGNGGDGSVSAWTVAGFGAVSRDVLSTGGFGRSVLRLNGQVILIAGGQGGLSASPTWNRNFSVLSENFLFNSNLANPSKFDSLSSYSLNRHFFSSQSSPPAYGFPPVVVSTSAFTGNTTFNPPINGTATNGGSGGRMQTFINVPLARTMELKSPGGGGGFIGGASGKIGALVGDPAVLTGGALRSITESLSEDGAISGRHGAPLGIGAVQQFTNGFTIAPSTSPFFVATGVLNANTTPIPVITAANWQLFASRCHPGFCVVSYFTLP